MNKKFWRGVLFNVFSLFSLITPTLILFLINADRWITQGEATKISIGVLIGLLYAIIVMQGALKEISPKSATLLSMFTFLAVIWFLDSLLADLFWIVLSVIVGYICYMFISRYGKREMEEYQAIKDEKVRVQVRQEANDDILGV